MFCCSSAAQAKEIKALAQNHRGNFKTRKRVVYAFTLQWKRKASCRKETTFKFSFSSWLFVGHLQQETRKHNAKTASNKHNGNIQIS